VSNDKSKGAIAAANAALPELRYSPLRAEDKWFPPARKFAGDAAYDIAVCRYTEVRPRCVVLLPTNLALALPDGCCGLLLPRSSASGRGLIIHPGTIDSGYRGEVMVSVWNYGTAMCVLDAGERVAQLLVLRRPRLELVEDRELLLEQTDRNSAGFGSTGR
jgi:dUTP pyrophosphatase